MKSDNKFYYVYDVNLSKYIKSNGISYIIKARSIMDNRIFTMYERTDELMNLIKTWGNS
ncbi:hypothetical protein MKZ17_10925 [Solibacillus sp. FSL R7-0682]|uniref:hypothetical protein n=1 Tax=Solibacillus sp. FSL R7-0682 TaxID=2921690 RepID=UPI0030F9EA9A